MPRDDTRNSVRDAETRMNELAKKVEQHDRYVWLISTLMVIFGITGSVFVGKLTSIKSDLDEAKAKAVALSKEVAAVQEQLHKGDLREIREKAIADAAAVAASKDKAAAAALVVDSPSKLSGHVAELDQAIQADSGEVKRLSAALEKLKKDLAAIAAKPPDDTGSGLAARIDQLEQKSANTTTQMAALTSAVAENKRENARTEVSTRANILFIGENQIVWGSVRTTISSRVDNHKLVSIDFPEPFADAPKVMIAIRGPDTQEHYVWAMSDILKNDGRHYECVIGSVQEITPWHPEPKDVRTTDVFADYIAVGRKGRL